MVSEIAYTFDEDCWKGTVSPAYTVNAGRTVSLQLKDASIRKYSIQIEQISIKEFDQLRKLIDFFLSTIKKHDSKINRTRENIFMEKMEGRAKVDIERTKAPTTLIKLIGIDEKKDSFVRTKFFSTKVTPPRRLRSLHNPIHPEFFDTYFLQPYYKHNPEMVALSRLEKKGAIVAQKTLSKKILPKVLFKIIKSYLIG